MKAKIAFLALAVAAITIVGAVWASSGNSIGNSVSNLNQNIHVNNTIRLQSMHSLANITQCKTTFINSAAPIVSNAFNINLDVSQVDSANARVQANVSENSSRGLILADIMSFNNAAQSLYWQARAAAYKANSTQIQNLKSELNVTTKNLKSCISTNSTSIFPYLGRVFGNNRYYPNWQHRRN